MAKSYKVTEEQWRDAEAQYVSGKISYAEVAEMCGCTKARAGKYGKDHGWAEKRKAYNERVKGKAIAKVESKDADRLAKVMIATNRLMDIAVQGLSEECQLHLQQVEHREKYEMPVDADGNLYDPETSTGPPIIEKQWIEEREFRKVDTRAMKDYAAVIKECARLLRDLYNVPTPAEREAQRVAAERLELEKQKATSNIGDDEDETGVVIMPEVMEPDSDG